MLLEALVPNAASKPGPTHPYWYEPVGRKTPSGERVTESSALTYSGCWAASNKIAGTLASLPKRLYQETSTGGRQEMRRDPLWSIVHDEPNPEMDDFTFWEMLISWWVNYGNGTAEIEYEDQTDPESPIVALWPIHPTRVRYERDDDGDLVYWVRNKTTQFGNVTLDETPLESWEVLNIVGHLSSDGIIGKGVIEFMCNSIGVGLALEKHQGAFFGNGVQVSGVLTHPRKPSKSARQTMRREWREVHQGASNHFRVATLWEGVQFVPMGQTSEAAQMIESATFRIDEMARAYDLPPHTLKQLANATFSNIDSQQISLVVDSYSPRLVRTEKAMRRQLLPVSRRKGRRRQFFKFITDALLRGDPVKRSAVMKTRFMHGSWTVNDWLKSEDMNPIGPLGDVRYVPANLVPLEEAGQNDRGGFGGEDNDPTGIPTDRQEQDRAEVSEEWLREVMGRMIAKDSADLSRISKKSTTRETLEAAVVTHYQSWKVKLAEAIKGPLRAMDIDPVEAAVAYADRKCMAIIAAIRRGEDDAFATTVELWKHTETRVLECSTITQT